MVKSREVVNDERVYVRPAITAASRRIRAR